MGNICCPIFRLIWPSVQWDLILSPFHSHRNLRLSYRLSAVRFRLSPLFWSDTRIRWFCSLAHVSGRVKDRVPSSDVVTGICPHCPLSSLDISPMMSLNPRTKSTSFEFIRKKYDRRTVRMEAFEKDANFDLSPLNFNFQLVCLLARLLAISRFMLFSCFTPRSSRRLLVSLRSIIYALAHSDSLVPKPKTKKNHMKKGTIGLHRISKKGWKPRELNTKLCMRSCMKLHMKMACYASISNIGWFLKRFHLVFLESSWFSRKKNILPFFLSFFPSLFFFVFISFRLYFVPSLFVFFSLSFFLSSFLSFFLFGLRPQGETKHRKLFKKARKWPTDWTTPDTRQ